MALVRGAQAGSAPGVAAWVAVGETAALRDGDFAIDVLKSIERTPGWG